MENLDPIREMKAGQRAMWALGEYHAFATSTIWQLGPVLAEACGIAPGHRVLDVAAGTGNVAIRAAQAGATVTAADLTPENFPAGRRAAAAAGVDVDWVEGDAEELPFEDASFDVVTSCFGAIFAPRHEAVARELLRVCRPGGTIGITAFTPEGAGGAFFEMLGRYAPPPPPGASSPLRWGREEHVRALLGEGVGSLEIRRREYVEKAASAEAYGRLFRETFGPYVGIRASLPDEPAREALDRDLLDFTRRWSRTTDGPVEVPYGYLLVTGRDRKNT